MNLVEVQFGSFSVSTLFPFTTVCLKNILSFFFFFGAEFHIRIKKEKKAPDAMVSACLLHVSARLLALLMLRALSVQPPCNPSSPDS